MWLNTASRCGWVCGGIPKRRGHCEVQPSILWVSSNVGITHSKAGGKHYLKSNNSWLGVGSWRFLHLLLQCRVNPSSARLYHNKGPYRSVLLKPALQPRAFPSVKTYIDKICVDFFSPVILIWVSCETKEEDLWRILKNGTLVTTAILFFEVPYK